MDLLEPAFEPAELRHADASIGASPVADGVERDESHESHVVHVIGDALVKAASGEAVAAAFQVSVDELAARDRPSLRIWGHFDRRAGHEMLGMVDEHLDGSVRIEAGRHVDWFAGAGHGVCQCRGHDADTLANLLVVAVAAQPGEAEAIRLELPRGLLEQARMAWKPKGALKEVTRLIPVRLPVDVSTPIGGLHAVVAGRPGIRTNDSSIEQGQEVGQLVVLRIVDRVAGHRDELHRRGGQRRGPNVVDRAHHRRDRAGVEHLLWAMHGEELAKTGVPSEAIDELEPGGRLGIGHMQVGDVHDACDRLAVRREIAGGS